MSFAKVMLSVLFSGFLFLGAASAAEPPCRPLMGAIDYSAYQQLRSAQDPAAHSANVSTSYGNRVWTFWIGSSAKQYLDAPMDSFSSRPPKSKLLWIQQEVGSPKVYLHISVGPEDRARSSLVEFDLRSRKSKMLVESFSPLSSEKLIIRKDPDIAIFKATQTPQSFNRFETTTYVDSWIIRLSDGQTKRISHAQDRVGLSHAGRAQIRYLRVPSSSDDILSVAIDGVTYYRGTTEWIRGGEFLITVGSKNLQVWRLDPESLNLIETPWSALGDSVSFASVN